ncbi:MAG: phosphoesterase, PA-phosphatase related protein [Acidobacteria bacterium]|nr:phosphoesterase, PA-phosphatase related protein [Acidobacteriota bacterium]
MQPPRSLSLLLAIVLSLLARPGLADAVLDWNDFALARVVAARQLPPEGARTMAMVHVAIFDALNALDGRYAPYAFDGHAPAGASAEAAAAAAARTVLVRLLPDQLESIEAAYAAATAGVPAGESKSAGIALGEAAGRACLARREGDGSGSQESYRPRTLPGVYVPTTLPVSSQWPRVRPWLLDDGAQLRPGPPPALGSAVWARDYEEVKSLGARTSAARTAAQTEAARFWTITGPLAWNPVVRALAASRPASPVENARLFALVGMAASDAFVAVFEAKYFYGFWRPITAIRNGDLDDNDATGADPSWLPLLETPMHPEYPCAHCITAGAVAEVLESEFGRGEVAPIEMTSPTAPGVTHRWTRIADYVTEVNQARIWGGIHYRNSTEVGEAMGRSIGALAVRKLLSAARAPGSAQP